MELDEVIEEAKRLWNSKFKQQYKVIEIISPEGEVLLSRDNFKRKKK